MVQDPGSYLSLHEGFRPTPYIIQAASCKSDLLGYYYPAHMASSGCWSNQGQTSPLETNNEVQLDST
jgi:hypothetical protein